MSILPYSFNFGSLFPQKFAGLNRNIYPCKGGKRYKVIASDGNSIDLMAFDRRSSEKGQTLVISCDGNAGFYEIGVLGTPLEMGYSVIGWNHPGFGGSTGYPYPQNEANAANAVMQFAINELGFRYIATAVILL